MYKQLPLTNIQQEKVLLTITVDDIRNVNPCDREYEKVFVSKTNGVFKVTSVEAFAKLAETITGGYLPDFFYFLREIENQEILLFVISNFKELVDHLSNSLNSGEVNSDLFEALLDNDYREKEVNDLLAGMVENDYWVTELIDHFEADIYGLIFDLSILVDQDTDGPVQKFLRDGRAEIDEDFTTNNHEIIDYYAFVTGGRNLEEDLAFSLLDGQDYEDIVSSFTPDFI